MTTEQIGQVVATQAKLAELVHQQAIEMRKPKTSRAFGVEEELERLINKALSEYRHAIRPDGAWPEGW
jgi:hypothetical protein